MNPAPNLILIGPMGAGKTCIGRRLAERFTLDFVDADQAIVDSTGASIPAIFEHSGEAGFRQHERQVLHALLDGHGQLVSTGGGAVLELARSGLALGLAGLFLEAHPDPDRALCDGPSALPLDRLGAVLEQVKAVDHLVKSFDPVDLT